MKSIYIIILVFLISVFFAGCSLEEKPAGLISPNVFYKSAGDFDAAINGAFKALFDGYGAFDFNNALTLCGGSEDVTSRYPAKNLKQFDDFIGDASAWQVQDLWQQLYKCINCCNLIVSNISNAALSQTLKDSYEGQARFLRAWCYYYLTRLYGKTPIITTENATDATNVGESEVADIYAIIVDDLQKAENLLPDSHGDKIKPSKGGAQLLLADVYLTMAGWPLKDVSNYAKARDEAQKIITSGSYGLESKFADLWKVSNCLTSNEIIFEFHGATNQSWLDGSHLHVASRPAEEGGWCDMFSDSMYYNAFPNGPRKDATFHTWFYFYKDNKLDSIYWKNSTSSYNQPFMAKFRDAGSATRADDNPAGQVVSNDGAGFFTVQRYAEAYLIYAEAANMAEGSPSSTAFEYLNKIRRRASGLDPNTPAPSVDLSGLSKQQFDDAVISEREWEFAFELRRWFDIVRKELLMTAPILQAEHGANSAYPVHSNNNLLPKPSADVQIIKGLNQNTGY